jgi:hypothetical protein
MIRTHVNAVVFPSEIRTRYAIHKTDSKTNSEQRGVHIVEHARLKNHGGWPCLCFRKTLLTGKYAKVGARLVGSFARSLSRSRLAIHPGALAH